MRALYTLLFFAFIILTAVSYKLDAPVYPGQPGVKLMLHQIHPQHLETVARALLREPALQGQADTVMPP